MGTIHDVKHFEATMLGAPRPNMGAAGTVIQILDACLVNGFNVQAVTGIMVQDGVATVTTQDADPGFREHQCVSIEGASPSELNGDWKINTTTGNTFKFPTTAPNGAATGTISAKTAPLGWTKEFSATNVAVYRPKTGLRHYFRVTDTSNSTAALRGYESMTGSGDSGTNPFPTTGQLSNGVIIMKATQSNNYKPQWYVVGDDRTAYLCFAADDHMGVLQVVGAPCDYVLYGFGEIISYVPNDVGQSFVAGGGHSSGASYSYASQNGLQAPGYIYHYHYSGCYLSRPYSQELGVPRRFHIAGSGLMEGWGSTPREPEQTPYPNPSDLGVLFHTPIHVQEEVSNAVRGELPGPYQLLHTMCSARAGEVMELNGRKIWLTRAYDNRGGDSWSGTPKTGIMGWDITGPWR